MNEDDAIPAEEVESVVETLREYSDQNEDSPEAALAFDVAADQVERLLPADTEEEG